MYVGQEEIRREVLDIRKAFLEKSYDICFQAGRNDYFCNLVVLASLSRKDAAVRESFKKMLGLVREALLGIHSVAAGNVPRDERTMDVLNFFCTSINHRGFNPNISHSHELINLFELMEWSLDWLLRPRLDGELPPEVKRKILKDVKRTIEFWGKTLESCGDDTPLFSDNFLAVRSF